MQSEAASQTDLMPFFETGAKESFSYRELRANFHIVNSRALWVSLVNADGTPSADFSIRQDYEGAPVLQADSRDATIVQPVDPLTLPPVPGLVEAGMPEAPVVPPAPRARKVPIVLFRGRNILRLVSAADDRVFFEFPMFYKTPARDWAESILKALIILVLIQFFVIQTFFIPTGSMKNTLMEKDFIMVEKVSYLFSEPQRGDVVVFQYPEDPRKDFIKRCVAREGDRVEVNRKKLIINGHELDEPYVHLLDQKGNPETVHRFQYDRDFYGQHPVPDRAIFCMGDNRNNSLDSRMWGPLPLYRMKGKAFLIYWPLKRFGLIKHQGGPFRDVDAPRTGAAAP